MSSYSAYDVSESAPAKWRPGEKLAASGFVAIIFYLFVDINLAIYRVFQKKQGLFYWCMVLGTCGCVIDSIGVVLKCFLNNPEPLWPLYTLFILGGWTIYAPAQLLVLYSRLHLVNQNRELQRWMLIMIIAVASLMIIPTWPIVWQAYNPYNARLSSLYSPREAILDRCTQLGYTIAEGILGGIYIWSLTKLLHLKSSVRERRVMADLIYVNAIAVCLDILTVVLVFLNQTGISHPIQTFSYILKIKMEFMVLKQLMAVAAQGVQTSRWRLESIQEPSTADFAPQLVAPSPALPGFERTPNGSGSLTTHDHDDGGKWPTEAKSKKRCAEGAGDNAVEYADEEIGLHMWEKHGKVVMEAPWFKSEEAQA